MAIKVFQASLLIVTQISLATVVIAVSEGVPPGGWIAARNRFLEKCTPTKFRNLISQEKELGKGTNGVVYLVRHNVTNLEYAMKAMNKNKKEAKKLFQAEARLLNAVDHPFILKFKFFFEKRKNCYLVTEHLSGGDLSKYLTRNGKLSEDVARYCIAEIVLALEYLHELGIIFRDLKPANVVIDSEGHLRLIDFGWAIVANNRGKAYEVRGTPLYFAPELVRGDAIRTRSVEGGFGQAVDCWALGLMLYFMITGNYLFDIDNMTTEDELFELVENASLDFLDTFECRANLRHLLKKLIERDENERYTIKQVKEHDWFKDADFEWDMVYNKKYEGQFPPN